MAALKAADVDAFVARPKPEWPVLLLYGPDAGLVRERADALIRSAVDDPADPFSLARLDGDELASDPSRLVEEANTVPLFGGRRAVSVKSGARNFAAAVEMLLAAAPQDCRVIVEAGDLKKNAPLRALIEKAKNAVALPCYADNETTLARLIDTEMRAAGLAIAPDARAALVPLLGGDRLASRSEIRKLALYACGKPRVEVDDIAAVVADASALMVDGIVDAAFAGNTGELETQLGKARIAGTSAGTILSAALRHVATLHKGRLDVEDGQAPSSIAERLMPSGQFRRRPIVEAALKTWSAARLERAMAQLAEAQWDTRRQADLADTIVERALLALAVNARRRSGYTNGP